ncbi:hypothetical protein FSP39_011936 [Pinctada imbricata]|uniref:Uncharacterized protein n=1 Tax=Pinctada imbricata TaxID=66713 RepID=A0AA89BSP8_PINIB|nr:hypothetical protein FSP39_011936 [Pinctada imbricata]
METQNNAIPSLIKVLQTIHNPEVLVEASDCLGNIAEHEPRYQQLVGTQQGCIDTMVSLMEEQKDKAFLHSLCTSIGKISHNEDTNQKAFVNAGVTPHIVAVTRLRNKEIQVSAVEAIHKLADNNPYTQKLILQDNVQELLLKLLLTTHAESVKEKTALALWAIAGQEFDVKRYIAEKMKVNTLIEFVNSMSEDLHYIGSEGLGVLAQGPLTYQSDIANANGIAPLGRLVRSDKEYIVLSVIRSIRYLCLGVGYVPHRKNQNTIMSIRGIKLIVALMVHSRNEMIQVESALTLASVSLGNPTILEDINQNIDFSYVRILKMMYSEEPEVRLLAGLALATFAYNNVAQQKEIADQGGVRFNCFIPFLQSNDEYYRCLSAFQVVVLARIIPDEEQALSSAAGIKLMVDLLQDSTSNETLSLAADCIARLAHTRAGIPSALISINVVDLLCKLLVSPAEQVRGCAAIALGYLSYNHTAERQLLNRCRNDPYLMRILLHYTKRAKVSPSFLEAWKHYKRVGLPPIPEGRLSLIGNKPVDVDDPRVLSLNNDESESNTRTSTSNIIGEDGRMTGRSSRGSQSRQTATPRQAHTPLHTGTPLNASQISLDSQHSSNSLRPVAVED